MQKLPQQKNKSGEKQNATIIVHHLTEMLQQMCALFNVNNAKQSPPSMITKHWDEKQKQTKNNADRFEENEKPKNSSAKKKGKE